MPKLTPNPLTGLIPAVLTPFAADGELNLAVVEKHAALLLGDRIPNLAGLKFTNSDLATFQRLLRLRDGRFDVVWGFDEYLLAALALGAEGAVGSTYNFAAPLYHRIIAALAKGDLAAARAEQFR